jgi:hypothetical protein
MKVCSIMQKRTHFATAIAKVRHLNGLGSRKGPAGIRQNCRLLRPACEIPATTKRSQLVGHTLVPPVLFYQRKQTLDADSKRKVLVSLTKLTTAGRDCRVASQPPIRGCRRKSFRPG